VLVLTIDTATAAVTAGLAWIGPDSVEVRAERVTVDARRHGEALAPGIRDCLAEIGASPADLAAVVAGAGPGPFTGLRVGLVTAAAFADSLRIPAYAVCTLDAIAATAPGQPLLVASDARRKEVYWATYDAAGARLTGPDVDRPADVDPGGSVAAAGAGAELYAEILSLPVTGSPYPPVAALAALAADRVRADAPGEPLTPLYLRRPDAVEPTARKAVLAR
jgi:tRNA threonylcarbamoyl adenosine modification protein YeaZ